jgi:hypothetical protein
MFSRVTRAAAIGMIAASLLACGAAPTAAPSPTSSPTALPAPDAAPSATAAATATSSPAAAATTVPTPAGDAASGGGGAAGFAPAQRSVWNTTIGTDQMSGECAKGSVLPAYGLVQITPLDAGLEWKNQEPKPYVMSRVEPNIFAFAGPNSIADGVVTMTVTFLDEKSLTMVREFTPHNDPGCTHRHEYTGVFQWFR